MIRLAINSPLGLLLRPLDRGGNNAPIWTPAANWPTAESPGFWLDPSSFFNIYQDSAGTSPATAVEQPAGRVLDKSGRGNHFSQATSTSRPIIRVAGGVQSLAFDGLDDSLSTSPITLGGDMDCFIAVRGDSAANAIVAAQQSGAARFFGYSESAASLTVQGSGTAHSTYVDAAFVGGASATAQQLKDALTPGAWHILEVRNLDLSPWTAFGLSNYGGYRLNGGIAGIILCPAGSEATRAKNREWLGAKVGLTL